MDKTHRETQKPAAAQSSDGGGRPFASSPPVETFDAVDEASAESFPASDPPSFTSFHAGGPTRARPEPSHHTEPSDELLVGVLCLGGAAMLLVGAPLPKWLSRVLGLGLAGAGVRLLRRASKRPA